MTDSTAPLFQYYVAASVDGFIADRDGSIDWLLAFGMDEFTAGYESFIAGVGAVVMGSSTYEFLLGEGPDAWSYDIPAWVLTTRELETIPGRDIRFLSGDVATHRDDIVGSAAGKNVWIVGGGDVAAQFSRAGLLDELQLTVMPLVLGAGAPLLSVDSLRSLELTGSTPFPSGAIELRYRVR
ncbi:dihydrofolate reductase family protein [Agromyces atrinae]|uniref:Dihydrofolate reductase n=1 Tax=Agromyces atrinae TaxID=592376 RepID=A0A4Q2M7D6_9MICO|nr:dihydrofolate reductase family protein [Agromyces atrinae]NYD65855.1 dihydrofolate reductase [Agromyces atrinae]RXZ86203.1 dihydrofolate reductase [Agromyces atrinae]